MLAETLDTLPLIAPTDYKHQLAQAATAFERASRSRVRAHHQQAQATRRAVKAIVREPAPKDGAALAILLDAILLAVVAAQHWHHTRHHDQQAEAARQTAEHLRTAYQAATAKPLAVVHERGRRLTISVIQQQGVVVRHALPDLADQILTESNWPALAATLADAETAGLDPTALLTRAARHRELDTATSISDVLTWRIHHLAGTAGESRARPRPATTTRPGSSAAVHGLSREQPPSRRGR
ncbi:hypothetical protein GCM10010302_35680 [Streptomyces polychromogenes]|uniref:Uncharacterized protein n=1 Tax=Streptomyces polychromogenes TaxID=67342 RepID=A0ABN0VF28_9ACTN